jgi:hypothetical protein
MRSMIGSGSNRNADPWPHDVLSGNPTSEEVARDASLQGLVSATPLGRIYATTASVSTASYRSRGPTARSYWLEEPGRIT